VEHRPIQPRIHPRIQHVKKDWLSFRATPIRACLDEIFDAFAISRNGPDITRGWKDWQYDLRWLKQSLAACSKKYQDITSYIATLSNMITSSEAVEENKRAAEATKRTSEETSRSVEISIFAFILIPLSLVASLFSMDPDIQPGGPKFWLYFATAIPFTLFVLLLVWLSRLITSGRLSQSRSRMQS